MFNPPVSKASVLSTCARIAKCGEMYHVNIYRYGEQNKRKTCFELKAEGKLMQGESVNKCFTFYRPEDVEVIRTAEARHQQRMKKIHAKNADWHIGQAQKHSPDNEKSLYHYHMKEAEKERQLAQ